MTYQCAYVAAITTRVRDFASKTTCVIRDKWVLLVVDNEKSVLVDLYRLIFDFSLMIRTYLCVIFNSSSDGIRLHL